MKCPFLEEESVRSCGVSPYRKMVRRSSIHETDDRCSSPEYAGCPAAQGHLLGRENLQQCPFLQESLVQYCSAAQVTKFIPRTDGSPARCNSDAHRYCQLYIQRARPEPSERRSSPPEGIPLPGGRSYSSNHMWVDVGEDEDCHVGVDGFLARVLGDVERVSFVSGTGPQRPTAVLTVQGVDLFLTFPCCLNVTASNVVLRARPETLLADPYGSGWLYEARTDLCDENGIRDENCELLRGERAEAWMNDEVENISNWVHELSTRRRHEGESLVADGGIFSPGLAQHLNREELLHLYNCFFGLR